ncbi:DUF3226 domain-containing protein [Flagellimonas sp.]|uniref:DUF3226 domain-containing protein n=1 Tax=Flagellimonas sp. TaxID=2058762 RepID=UPI003B5CC034
MAKYIIFLEGCSDAVFFNNLIFSLLPQGAKPFTDLKKFKKGVLIEICENPSISLFVSGGCAHIRNYNVKISEYIDSGYKVILIQDADSSLKDAVLGGVKKRNQFLESIKEEFEINFDVFLLPNNKDDGDLEDMLLQIADIKKYSTFYKNYKGYSCEVENFSCKEHASELLQKKYLIFNYCQVYTGMKESNEKNRNYLSEYWDLNHNVLTPVKEFLVEKLNL